MRASPLIHLGQLSRTGVPRGMQGNVGFISQGHCNPPGTESGDQRVDLLLVAGNGHRTENHMIACR